MNFRNIAAALIAAAPLLAPSGVRAQDLGIDVGAKAPVVMVQSLDGKDISLGNYIGKTPMLIESGRPGARTARS